MADHEHYMRIALEEAERGAAEGNAAVGSILVRAARVVALGHTDFSKLTLYTTFEPCPMCCGAILASGVNTLVMGARHDLAQSRWGAYTVEKLLELTNRAGQLIVITGVLPQACADVRKLETI